MPQEQDQKKKPERARRPRRPKPQIMDWAKYDPALNGAPGNPPLIEEMITYRDNLPELMKRKGAYVIIKGKDMVILDDQSAAITYMLQHHPSEDVLIKKIIDKEPVVTLGGGTIL